MIIALQVSFFLYLSVACVLTGVNVISQLERPASSWTAVCTHIGIVWTFPIWAPFALLWCCYLGLRHMLCYASRCNT